MGKFDKKGADRIFGFGTVMAAVVGILLFALTALLGEAYLKSSSPAENVLNQALDYLFWMRFAFLIIPFQMLLAAAVYGDGDEAFSTAANLTQGLGNIAASIIFSRFMGIKGIALASFLFSAVSILILLAHFARKTNSLRINLYFSFDLVKKILKHSTIDASSYLFLAVVTAVLNAFIGSHFGSEYLILTSIFSLCRELQLVFEGIGKTVGPIFAVYVGERNRDGLKSSFSLANKTALIEGNAVTLVMIIIAPFVPGFLNVADPVLAGWVVKGVRLIALGSTFLSLLYLLTTYYLVIERIILGLAACTLRDALFSITFAVSFGSGFGIWGMFIGLATAPAAAYALLMLFIRIRYGKDDCPLLLSKISGSNNCYLFSLSTEPNEIIAAQSKAEAVLKRHGVNKKTITRVILLIEEMYVLIRQTNSGKAVLAECTMILRDDGVQLISKDDGVSFDMADEDVSTVSLAAYTVASYLEKKDYSNRHLTTMSFNRSAFLVKYDEA